MQQESKLNLIHFFYNTFHIERDRNNHKNYRRKLKKPKLLHVLGRGVSHISKHVSKKRLWQKGYINAKLDIPNRKVSKLGLPLPR